MAAAALLAFLLGNISFSFLRNWPETWTIVGFLTIFLLLAVLLFFFKKYLSSRLKILVTLLFCFIFGHLWILVFAFSVCQQAIPTAVVGKPIIVEGQIVGIPVINDHCAKFEFQVNRLPDAPAAWPYPGKVTLIWYWKNNKQGNINTRPELSAGDPYVFTVNLKKPRGFSNPGSFDTEKLFFIRRIVAEGKVVTQNFDRVPTQIWHLSDSIDRLRLQLKAQMEAITGNLAHKGILQALTLGIRDKIDRSEWRLFQKTGTAHLMAISGLHVGLVAGLCFYLGFFLWARCVPLHWLHRIPAPMAGAIGSISGALIYALLAGFSVPTQRALVMVFCAMLGVLLRRRINSWRLYGIALIAVLLIDPMATLSIGFWLSFGAVGVILYGMQNRLKPSGLWWKYGRIQWIAFVGLFPLSVYGFQGVSLVSPLANMLAIPWVSFVTVPTALMGVLLAPIGEWAAQACLHISSLSLSVLLPILSIMSKSTLSFWTFPVTQSVIPLLCAGVGVLIILLPRGMPGRWLGILWLLPLCMPNPKTLDFGHAMVTVLDVGQGLATVVKTKNHVLIFDTGAPMGKHSDMGDQVILPYLSTLDFGKPIDRVIVSHVDSDHSGGLTSLVKSNKVKHIMTSEPEVLKQRLLDKEKIESICLPTIALCQTNQSWNWDGVTFEILHPVDPSTIPKRNNRSCVLRVSAGSQRILMTGDIESRVERNLMRAAVRDRLSAAVMVVPHHGSKTSSDFAFIKHVDPEYAVVSTGYMNRYGHPKKTIMQRYKQLGIQWLDTTKSGAITFHLDPNATKLSPPTEYRVSHHKIWLSDLY
jgi:competence protein ComEC